MKIRELFIRFRSAPDLGLHCTLAGVTIFVLPKFAAELSDAPSIRYAALGVLAVTIALGFGQFALLRTWRWSGRGAYAAVAAAAGVAALAPKRETMLLVPALGLCGLGITLLASAARPPSIIERAAFWLEPLAPDFIRPYCRAASAIWAVVFGVAGLAVSAFTWLDSPDAGRAGLTWLPVVLIGLASIEFVFRKWWFRHYEHKWYDRLFARLFPWDRTDRGRRSQAYLDSLPLEHEATGDAEPEDPDLDETDRPSSSIIEPARVPKRS